MVHLPSFVERVDQQVRFLGEIGNAPKERGHLPIIGIAICVNANTAHRPDVVEPVTDGIDAR